MRRILQIGVAVFVVFVVLGIAVVAQRMVAAFDGTADPGWYARTVYPLEHGAVIRAAAAKNDVDPALVAAVIYVESGFDEHARSAQGAVGLMQVLPETAREIARRTGGSAF